MNAVRNAMLLCCCLPALALAQARPSAPTSNQGQTARQSIPPWQTPSPWPDRIVVTLEGDPQTTFSVTWRTDRTAQATRAEIVPAAAHSRFDMGASVVKASSETVELSSKQIGDQHYPLRWNEGLAPARYHTARFTGLKPDTLYAYRVMGAEGHWSEWLQTRTAPKGDAPIKFLYFGDAQDGILSHWARVIRGAYAEAPDARFAIHAGDLVNLGGRDFEWAEWFKSVSFIHGMIPALPVPGNHEYFDGLVTADRRPILELSALWRPQFALPQYQDLPEALRETVYAIDYGDLIVVALNTMADEHFEAQARWLDRVLGESTARWRILTSHHPLFELLQRPASGFPETGAQRRELFLPLLDKHRVDLALQGHDHAYGRGAILERGRGMRLTRAQSVSTVFVTSSSGAKMYEIKDDAWAGFADSGVVLQRQAENTQFFQVIAIDGDELSYQAFTAAGDLYDSFRISKVRGRPNRITELAVDLKQTRMFENTPEYENDAWDRLPPKPAPDAAHGD